MLHPVTAIVLCLALVVYFALTARVGWARGKYKIDAPAISGHPDFERVFRVQQNTLENLIMFVPGLWLFSNFVSPLWASGIGFVWIIARIWYARAYYADAKMRGPGFGLSAFLSAVLIIGAIIGAGMAYFGAK